MVVGLLTNTDYHYAVQNLVLRDIISVEDANYFEYVQQKEFYANNQYPAAMQDRGANLVNVLVRLLGKMHLEERYKLNNI